MQRRAYRFLCLAFDILVGATPKHEGRPLPPGTGEATVLHAQERGPHEDRSAVLASEDGCHSPIPQLLKPILPGRRKQLRLQRRTACICVA